MQAALERDLEKAFRAFQMDPNMNLSMPDARRLFDEMAENTKKYLGMYFN